MENNEKYLPVGTVVKLKNATKKIIILGYCSSLEGGPNQIFDYCGCPFPEGVVSSNAFGVFNHEQIEEICFKGFVTEEQLEFVDIIKKVRKLKENNEIK